MAIFLLSFVGSFTRGGIYLFPSPPIPNLLLEQSTVGVSTDSLHIKDEISRTNGFGKRKPL